MAIIIFSILIKPRRCRRPVRANWPSSFAFPELVARDPPSIIKINWPKYIGNNIPRAPIYITVVSSRSLKVLIRSAAAQRVSCYLLLVGYLLLRSRRTHTHTHTRRVDRTYIIRGWRQPARVGRSDLYIYICIIVSVQCINLRWKSMICVPKPPLFSQVPVCSLWLISSC